MSKITLIQPRHIYAPNSAHSTLGHIYMPSSLLTAAAMIGESGTEIEIIDENISPYVPNNNTVGINLLGAPYIPVAQRFDKLLRSEYGDNYKLLVGGQIVNGLSEFEFEKLFSPNVINGNSINNIATVLNTNPDKIPKPETISLIPIYEALDHDLLKLYLTNEFGFYLSQGCKHSCSFCSAHRTMRIDNKLVRVKEVYRNIDIALLDFRYLVEKAVSFNIKAVNIYLSNLDLFQTPDKLSKFATGLLRLREQFPSVDFKIRGLATVRSFLNVHRKFKEIIWTMRKAGLMQVGFGIDGATPEVYAFTKKPQEVQECLDAIRLAKVEYGIVPETLMVFGHNHAENEYSLQRAYEFCKEMHTRYGALPRPHISKDIVPGNDGWRNPANSATVQMFIDHPSLFQNLDFTALPSPITHPDDNFRNLVSQYYKMVCELPGSLTKYIYPETLGMTLQQLSDVRSFNEGRYDL